jgi:hypothetical protein
MESMFDAKPVALDAYEFIVLRNESLGANEANSIEPHAMREEEGKGEPCQRKQSRTSELKTALGSP